MPDEHEELNVKSYQEELSETVDDGGGCAETWGALGDVRKQIDARSRSRRRFLRGVGGAAAGATLFGAIDPVTAAETGPFANLTRSRLQNAAAEQAIEEALASKLTRSVVEELPDGSDDLTISEATVYRIVDESGDAATLTQVLIPVESTGRTLGYSTNTNSAAAGTRLSDDRLVQALEVPNHVTDGVEHKRIAQNGEQRKLLDLVRANEGYQQTIQEVGSDYRVEENQAQVSIIEEQEIGFVYVPAPPSTESESANASSKVVLATVDLDSNNVITVQQSYWDCMATCAATSPEFWGICWTCCCQWCWADPTRATCVVCFGCIGFTLAYCTGQCV